MSEDRFREEEALALLNTAGVFYPDDPEDAPGERYTLNTNDTWGWAIAWGEDVPKDKIVEVARLFIDYGWCGLLYWVSEQHEQMRSEFEDINRFVDFVRCEEQVKKDEPNSSRRAYKKVSYALPTLQSPPREPLK